MSRKRRGSSSIPRFVSLRHWLLDSPAWRNLPPTARVLYIELARKYNGSNNGRISYSIRQALQDLHIGNTAARRAFWFLQDHGFIVCTKKGAFSLKAVRDASEWRLAEYDSDFPVEHATKNFMSWQPAEPKTNEPAKSRTRCLKQHRTVPRTTPHGASDNTVDPKKGLYGAQDNTVNPEKDGSTVPETTHLYLPGTSGSRSAPEGSAVASEPPDWNAQGYPPNTPSREEHLAALERKAQERARSRPPRPGGVSQARRL